jgi:hypothetical protein
MGKELGPQEAVRQRLRGRFDRLRELSSAGVDAEADRAPAGAGRRGHRDAAGAAAVNGNAARSARHRRGER